MDLSNCTNTNDMEINLYLVGRIDYFIKIMTVALI